MGACPPIPEGEYRASLNGGKFFSIIASSLGELRMKVEGAGGVVITRGTDWYDFNSDCKIEVADKYSRDDFAAIRAKLFEIERMLTVEEIKFDYRVSKFVIGYWLSVPKVSSSVPNIGRGVFNHVWRDIGASVEILNDSKMVFMLPVRGTLKRVEAHYVTENSGKVFIVLKTDEMGPVQYAMDTLTGEWPLSTGFSATVEGNKILIGRRGVFERS